VELAASERRPRCLSVTVIRPKRPDLGRHRMRTLMTDLQLYRDNDYRLYLTPLTILDSKPSVFDNISTNCI
jgi:hypothetical protein